MDSESKRARENNYENPILPTLEETHNNYNAAIEVKTSLTPTRDILQMLLDNVDTTSFMIATHNEASVKLAYDVMQKKNISPSNEHVHFGQLYGMCDQLSYAAAAQGEDLNFEYERWSDVERAARVKVRTVRAGGECSALSDQEDAREQGSDREDTEGETAVVSGGVQKDVARRK